VKLPPPPRFTRTGRIVDLTFRRNLIGIGMACHVDAHASKGPRDPQKGYHDGGKHTARRYKAGDRKSDDAPSHRCLVERSVPRLERCLGLGKDPQCGWV
jgi:hypothetical protein